MKIRLHILLVLLLTLLLQFGCSNNKHNTNDDNVLLTISAAISLMDALEEIKEQYEYDHQVELTFNFAGSGTLAQQIQQGAPSDIFISANEYWMDILDENNLITRDTRTNVTGNKLALITSKNSSLSYQSFTEISSDDIDQIAIGNPESVPAGAYTNEVLNHLELWDELADQIVLAKDVRQVLTYIESGNADIGFVYESDALSSDKVTILATADDDLHSPIIYPMAVIADTKHKNEAEKFVTFLNSDVAQKILLKYGFSK